MFPGHGQSAAQVASCTRAHTIPRSPGAWRWQGVCAGRPATAGPQRRAQVGLAVGRFANLEIAFDKLTEKYVGKSPSIAKVHVIAREDTAKAVATFDG